MTLKNLPTVNKHWSLFPATKTVAFYSPEAQYIELSEVSRGRLEIALSGQDPSASLEILPTLLHEIRHWIDHCSTVWGRQRLVLLFEALNARLSNNEHEFWRIISYKRAIRDDVRDAYFSLICDTSTLPTQNWRWLAESTMGFAFDPDGHVDKASPIVFARFLWPDGNLACRVPLCTATLLETNAVQSEIEATLALINHMDQADRIVEHKLAEKKWLNQLYNPELGMYSAAVHLAANRLEVIDIPTAYRYSSTLAAIALNTPTGHFLNVKLPKEFSPWHDHHHAALHQHNRGYLYLVLLYSSPPTINTNIDDWADETLARAGLPDLTTFGTDVRTELDTIGRHVSLAEPLIRRFRVLEHIGDTNANLTGIRPPLDQMLDLMQALHLCPIVTGDLEYSLVGKPNNTHNVEDFDNWHALTTQLLGMMSEFADACH